MSTSLQQPSTQQPAQQPPPDHQPSVQQQSAQQPSVQQKQSAQPDHSINPPDPLRFDMTKELSKMTWLAKDSDVLTILPHEDLWPDIQALSAEEWESEYGLGDFVCRKRIKRFIDEAIASRKRQRSDDDDGHAAKKAKMS